MQMGIGWVGSPRVIIKRKFRWTMLVRWGQGGNFISYWYVKVAARPKFTVDNAEIPFLNATTWMPGRVKWDPIQVSFHDVGGDGSSDMASLYGWILSLYNFNDQVNLYQSEKVGWYGEVELGLYDGCGSQLERWTLDSCYPETVDFGGLDYGSSEAVTVDLTLRYSDVKYEGVRCNATPVAQCLGCLS